MHMRPISILTYLLISALFLINPVCHASIDRYAALDSLLTQKTKDIPALDEKISISVSGVSLEEFLRGVANSSGLNLDVQPGLNFTVVNNFSNVRVKDVLIYVCRQFELDLQIVGNIISIVKPTNMQFEGSESVKWDEALQLITIDFSNIPIEQAIKEISLKTKANIIISPNAFGKNISGYISSQPLKNALEMLAFSNGLSVRYTDDNYYILELAVQPQDISATGSQERSNRRTGSGMQRGNKGSGEYELQIDQNDDSSFNIHADNAPIPVIIKELSDKAGFSYFLSPKAEETATLQINNAGIEEILNNLFSGTEIGFRKTNGIYLIGERSLFDFNEHRVIQLQNRSVEKLVESIPEDIKKNISIIEYTELNSLFVSGASYELDQFEKFIKSIDKVVPVVLIEVIILYINKSFTVTTGIQAGIGQEPTPTTGTLFPGVDLQIGSAEVNRILDDMGWVNLGRVTPNFYITLKALEEQGYLDMQSTPKLATLNGHEAELSIGNTEYYLEEQTQLFGTQNPQQTTTQEYKAVNAELSIKIKPIVSADEQITLEVTVHQSDFTERISKTAPPGSVNRDFTSQIRVKNEEMILLGGLMEKRKSDSSTGTPLISRIPILKWLFSSRKREDSDSKLSVLIKPTIIN
jgi:type IV pilus assembly protein PilQ